MKWPGHRHITVHTQQPLQLQKYIYMAESLQLESIPGDLLAAGLLNTQIRACSERSKLRAQSGRWG